MNVTTKMFVKKARDIHGDKYDYSNVTYVNAKSKVKIICPVHGMFEQTPDKHVNSKCGCPMCANNQQCNTSDFIEKAQSVHGNEYDYSKVNYVNNKTNVIITCKLHGDFEQSPSNHLSGKGCPRCANNVRLSNQEFIMKAKQVHGNKYDYGRVNYLGNRVEVDIICKDHGIFKQKPYSHLAGNGCPRCGRILQQIHRDEVSIRKKAESTCLQKYGVVNPMDVDVFKEKQKLKVQSSEVNEKRIATKRKNQSFNTSLVEYRLRLLLETCFDKDDIYDNYVSDKYPFKCDYYIKSRDLYIELNAHWTHGGHWYTDADEMLIQNWNCKSKFYQNAAYTFSVRDVNKRNIARMNNLNYIVFWKNDLSDVKKWIKCGCPDGQDWKNEYSWLL